MGHEALHHAANHHATDREICALHVWLVVPAALTVPTMCGLIAAGMPDTAGGMPFNAA